MIGEAAKPKVKTGDMASHRGDIRLIDNLTKFRSGQEQRFIDKLFVKLARGDRQGLERSLRNKSATSLKQRGVIDVERSQ
jgi:hypothetical protein